MPSRPRPAALRALAGLVGAGLVLVGCGDGGVVEQTADRRSDQARQAALDAGLDAEVADFLGLLATGDTATYRVRFPGPSDGTELVVRNRPPDRRVDVLAAGELVEVRQVVGGEAFTCTPSEDEGAEEQEGALRCERTDALVDPPGLFRAGALERLTEGLADRLDAFTFAIDERTIAGVEARCLHTRRRAGRDDPELGAAGTICASPEGVVLLVDQGDERLEALDYGTDVDPSTLERVDGAG